MLTKMNWPLLMPFIVYLLTVCGKFSDTQLVINVRNQVSLKNRVPCNVLTLFGYVNVPIVYMFLFGLRFRGFQSEISDHRC